MTRVALHPLAARGEGPTHLAGGARGAPRRPLGRAAAWLLAFVLAGLAVNTAAAGEAREYSRLLVQGKISKANRHEPLAGHKVVLKGETGSFAAVTDRAGVFVFERIPVATYDLEVVSPEGRVIRRARNVTSGDSPTKLLDVAFGAGDSTPVRVVPDRTGVAVEVAEPPPMWGRVGTESLIFVGLAALLLAL